jgi:predicted DNA-binding protein with PD1-like motif
VTRSLRLGDAYLLRLDTGEEIFTGIADFAARQAIEAGFVSGIGAARGVVLGYYDLQRREYIRRTIESDVEIVSLSGNIALKDERPFPHLHILVSGPDFGVLGGHFFEGRTAATCELLIRPLPGPARRVFDATTGLFLLDLAEETSSRSSRPDG